jgi:hypothetical protein
MHALLLCVALHATAFQSSPLMPPLETFGVPGYASCSTLGAAGLRMAAACQTSCDQDAARRGAVSLPSTCRVAWHIGIVSFACSCNGIEPTSGPSPNPGIDGCNMCLVAPY